MAANVPWSVNAVEPETWATARDAARRSGLSVGEWLETAIRGSAEEHKPGRATHGRSERNELHHQLHDIAERLDRLMERETPRERHERRSRHERHGHRESYERHERDDDAIAQSLDALTDRIDTLIGDIRADDKGEPHQIKLAIDRLDRRIEALFAQNQGAASATDPETERRLSALAHDLETMGQRIEQENARFPAPNLAPSIAELDEAIAEITVRQSTLEDGAASRDLDRKLASIDERFGFSPRSDVQLVGLEQQIKQLTDEMQALRRSGVQADAFETLRRDIGELSRQFGELTPRRAIEALEATVAGLAVRIDRAAVPDRADHSGEVVDALQEIRGALAEVRPAESFTAVRHDLLALSQKLDGLNERGIDGTTLSRLQAQTAEIRDLLSNALPGDALKTLIGQIETLVQRSERAPSPNEGTVLDVLAALERRINGFAERAENAARQPASAPALDEIKNRLAQIESTLDRGDSSTPGLENSMHSLVAKLDQAEARLANIGSLERGLSELFDQIKEIRASAVEVAERAAQAEPAAAAQPAAAEPHAPRPVHENEAKPLVATRDLEPLVATRDLEPVLSPASVPNLPEAVAPRPVALDPKTALVTSSSDDDYPLEPGSGSPRAKPAQSAMERVARSEAALGGIDTGTPEHAGSAADYIAAARRAAQAAAAKQTTNAEVQASRPRTSLTSLLNANRRPIMLGVLLILIAFTAVRFGGLGGMIPFLHSTTPAATKAPAANDQPPVTPAPDTTPAKPEDQSALPPQGNLAFTDPAAVRMVAPNLTAGLLDPQTTGSIQTKPAAAPAPDHAITALPDAMADRGELPETIGTVALRMAALAGDPAAAYEIGTRWFDGTGVAPDSAQAKRWFELASAKGSIPAAYRLGNIYEKGNGAAKDLDEARRFYLLAAEAGNAKAMHNLGVLYSEGFDGKPDYKTAAHWFRKAAERNIRDSQYNLAVLYARGAGVERNFAESYRWFALAAAQNDADALKKRDSMAKHLDAKVLEALQRGIRDWKATPLDEAANQVRLDPLWLAGGASSPSRKKSDLQ